MTQQEVNIALKYHLPVEVDDKYAQEKGIESGEYHITELAKKYLQIDRAFRYSATLSKNQKNLYIIEIGHLVIPFNQSAFYELKIIDEKKKQDYAVVKSLFEKYKNKKSVYKYVGEIIDKIKSETKGK